ncbi:MAG: hypothetical protein U5K69_15060 [Balneolaceae bacterium]|nr:hypothetical protein [Balneolaceae bacterium]
MQQKIGSSLLITINASFIILLLAGIYGCSPEEQQRVIFSVEDEDAEQYSDQLSNELSPSLTKGLDLSLWASEKLVSDPVAIHVDDLGRVLVTITERRRNAELDIRGHRDWMIESVGFESVEDRRDFLHRELSPKRSEENGWLEDHNGDDSHDWHDLTVNKESVFRLEDLSGNGYANQAQLFVRIFTTKSPMWQGLYFIMKEMFSLELPLIFGVSMIQIMMGMETKRSRSATATA